MTSSPEIVFFAITRIKLKIEKKNNLVKLKGIKNIYVNKKNQINKSQNRYNKNKSKQTIGNLKKNSINGHTWKKN